ncbi:hypothetical protein AB0F17_35025 [Nonomuraea sp. NPDC026600]|uniref:hypothetical protein n=1 Tax=Nonomuraea sp. NPDC026600 TaxID=3155363 RepID=UPI003409B1CB
MRWISERQQQDDSYADDMLRGLIRAEAWEYESRPMPATSPDKISHRLRMSRTRVPLEGIRQQERATLNMRVGAFAVPILGVVAVGVGFIFYGSFYPRLYPMMSSEMPLVEPSTTVVPTWAPPPGTEMGPREHLMAIGYLILTMVGVLGLGFLLIREALRGCRRALLGMPPTWRKVTHGLAKLMDSIGWAFEHAPSAQVRWRFWWRRTR